MSKTPVSVLELALNKYFAQFDSTKALVLELLAAEKNPIEVLILLCSRIDALASDAAPDGTANKQAFVRFLSSYSHDQDLLTSVSIGDLYYELGYHRWSLAGTITKPGRLHRFSSIDDPILQLLEGAGLALTFDESDRLLATLMRVLRATFHAVPRQRRSKERTVSRVVLEKAIVDAFRQSRLSAIADNLPNALKALFERKAVSTILYEKFRCESIHGASLILNNKRFFTETDAYWESLFSEYFGSFELIEFPAKFLVNCVDSSITTYRAHLLAKGKVPPSIHFFAFRDVMSNLQFLDDSLLPEGGALRFKFAR
jgi:hypothetical protein